MGRMPQVTRAEIAAIWRAHALGVVASVVPAASGSRNETYLVNDAYVLRINTRDAQFAKFRNERLAYDLLLGSRLPVPRVVALDESRRILPYNYMIVTRLPGTNLRESWQSLDAPQVFRLAWEAGCTLARLHAVTLAGFGPLHRLADRSFGTWYDYFRDYAGRYTAQAWERGVLNGDLHARLIAVLDRASPLLARVTTGVLVHSDYHYENILQDDGALSGLLDFEWALSGDPAFDFVAGAVRATMIPDSEVHFVAGYATVRPLDAEHARRVALYRLFFHLEVAATLAMQHDTDEMHAASLRLANALAAVEGAAATPGAM